MPHKHRTIRWFKSRLVSSTVGITLILIFFGLPSETFAYIDLGTGSQFIQILIAGLLAVLYALKLYWMSIKRFVSSRWDQLNKRFKRR